VCPTGYTGDLCESTFDLCDAQPCFNGGTCIQGATHVEYTCACLASQTGDHCETSIASGTKLSSSSGAVPTSILIAVVAGLAALVALVAIVAIVRRRRQEPSAPMDQVPLDRTTSVEYTTAWGEAENFMGARKNMPKRDQSIIGGATEGTSASPKSLRSPSMKKKKDAAGVMEAKRVNPLLASGMAEPVVDDDWYERNSAALPGISNWIYEDEPDETPSPSASRTSSSIMASLAASLAADKAAAAAASSARRTSRNGYEQAPDIESGSDEDTGPVTRSAARRQPSFQPGLDAMECEADRPSLRRRSSRTPRVNEDET
jgi:hypothetical protein